MKEKNTSAIPKSKHLPGRGDNEQPAETISAGYEDHLRRMFQEFLARQAVENLPPNQEPPPRKLPSKNANPLGTSKKKQIKKAQPAAETAPAPDGGDQPPRENPRQRGPGRRPKRTALLRIRVPLAIALALAAAAALAVFPWARSIGVSAGIRQAEDTLTKRDVPLDEETLAAFDDALALLQKERFEEAIDALAAIQAANPDLGSLSLLQGVAAIRTDNDTLANEKIRESIARGELVSDALALLAILEARTAVDQDYRTMGSPRHRISGYLERSIASDPASSRPFFEMGTLLRFQNDWDGARRHFESALLRLSPVDSALATSLALELTNLQAMPDSELPPIPEPGTAITDNFTGAYIALRRGDQTAAANLLDHARAMLPPRIFEALYKDPAFASFRDQPALARFNNTSATTN